MSPSLFLLCSFSKAALFCFDGEGIDGRWIRMHPSSRNTPAPAKRTLGCCRYGVTSSESDEPMDDQNELDKTLEGRRRTRQEEMVRSDKLGWYDTLEWKSKMKRANLFPYFIAQSNDKEHTEKGEREGERVQSVSHPSSFRSHLTMSTD